MCDCYNHPCKICGGNGGKVAVHLGDFATGRGEIDAYCVYHWKKARQSGKPFSIFKIGRMGFDRKAIVYLTANAEAKRKQNHPNEAHYEEIEDERGVV